MKLLRFSPALVALGLLACKEELAEPEPDCTADTECSGDAPFCAEAGVCTAMPAGGLIGWEDREVTFTEIFVGDGSREAIDLAFNPDRPEELWIINRATDSVYVITDPGTDAQQDEHIKDPAAAHFMDRPPAIAMGASGTWATCGDSDNGGNDFMGPALFTTDLTIFATQNEETGLGSHLDMLHSTTFCRGIAHEEANIYWVFNSNKGSLDRYDFKVDHGPGFDDHSDGVIQRFAEGQVKGVDGISSHLAFHDGMLYVADTGNQRIIRFDPSAASAEATFSGQEPADRTRMSGGEVVEVVPPGTLEAPSGLEIHDGAIYVSDSATGTFYAFDMGGTLLGSLEVGGNPGSLSGMTVGPDGKLWFTESTTSRVYRVDVE